MSKLKIAEQIVIGVDRNHLDHFNDANHLKEANKIQSIKVSVNDSGISGIQFTYHEFRADKQVHGHDSTHGGNNVLEHVFQIPPNDFLQIVYGNFDGRITSIGFITYKGKQAMFGYEVGRKFKNLIMGFTFTSASGCYQKGKQLDMLALRVVQLPREYLELNWPPLIEVVYQSNNPYMNLQTELLYGGNQGNRVEVAVNQPYGMQQPREEVIVEQNQYGQTEVIEFQQYQQQPQQQYYQPQQFQQFQQPPPQQFQPQQQQFQPPPQQEVIIEQNAYGQTEYIAMQNQPYYQPPRQNEVIIEQGPYGQVDYVQVQNPPMRQQEVIIQQGPYGQQNQVMMQQNQYGMYGNQTVIIEQQQQQQQRGMGVGGAMMMGALGTMAAIDTVNMLDHHHHRRHEDIVVVNEHHHHHRR